MNVHAYYIFKLLLFLGRGLNHIIRYCLYGGVKETLKYYGKSSFFELLFKDDVVIWNCVSWFVVMEEKCRYGLCKLR